MRGSWWINTPAPSPLRRDNGGAHSTLSPIGTQGINPRYSQQGLLMNAPRTCSRSSLSHFPTTFLVLPKVISNPCQCCCLLKLFPSADKVFFKCHVPLVSPPSSPVRLFSTHSSSSPSPVSSPLSPLPFLFACVRFNRAQGPLKFSLLQEAFCERPCSHTPRHHSSLASSPPSLDQAVRPEFSLDTS